MDDRTQADETRDQRQRDARSAALDREVNAEIAARAKHRDMAVAADAAKAERLAAEAGRLDRLELDQRKAAAEASTSARVRGRAVERDLLVSRVSRVVTYIFSLAYGVLLIGIVLALLGASPSTPFVRMIHAIVRPLSAPFEGIASAVTTNPDARLVAPMVVAILVGALVHAAIIGLLRLFAPREIP